MIPVTKIELVSQARNEFSKTAGVSAESAALAKIGRVKTMSKKLDYERARRRRENEGHGSK
jgi:hypothetical protein